MLLVGAVRVGQAHVEHAAVAVHVLHRHAVGRLLVERVAARGRADEARHVRQRQLGAVGVQARHHVDHAGVQQVGQARVGGVVREQVMQVVQRRGAGREFGGVDVAVDPERGLGRVGAGGLAREHQQPDVAPFVAVADGAQLDDVGARGGIGLQQGRQFRVAREAAEVGSRQGGCVHGGGRNDDARFCPSPVSGVTGQASATATRWRARCPAPSASPTATRGPPRARTAARWPSPAAPRAHSPSARR